MRRRNRREEERTEERKKKQKKKAEEQERNTNEKEELTEKKTALKTDLKNVQDKKQKQTKTDGNVYRSSSVVLDYDNRDKIQH